MLRSPTRMMFWAIVLCLLLVLSQSGFHETTEQRVAVPRRRGELGVELASNKPWMIRGFDYFHQRAVTGTTGGFQASFDQLRQQVVVHFVAMTEIGRAHV